jgi:hypothetical protein
MAYMPWGTEKDLFGAVLYQLDPQIPALFLYFVFSLIFSYIVCGLLIQKITGSQYFWLMSALLTIFNIARHFKLWFHYELLTLHWAYICILLDVLIWQRFIKDKKWDVHLELWRILGFLGMLGTAAYWFGPIFLSFMVTRLFMVGWALKKRNHFRIQWFQWNWRNSALCLVIAGLFLLNVYWYLPLLAEVAKDTNVYQPSGFSARTKDIFHPVWLRNLFHGFDAGAFFDRFFTSMHTTETVVAVGWSWLILLFVAVLTMRRHKNLKRLVPFLIIFLFGVLYMRGPDKYFQDLARQYIPVFSFFRVASRWGLFYPILIFAIAALAHKEIFAFWSDHKRRKLLLVSFGLIACLEISTLARPVSSTPALSMDAQRFFAEIKQSPGTAVLDFPFAVVGGNGVCREISGPFYPRSVSSQCFLTVHQKKVFTTYQGRATEAMCKPYTLAPYADWFRHWKNNDCFAEHEVKDLCAYLRNDPNIGSLLISSGIWTAFAQPQCRALFEKYFGPPVDSAIVPVESEAESTVFRYRTQCLSQP